MIRHILLSLCVTVCLVPALPAQDKTPRFLSKTAKQWSVQLRTSQDLKQQRGAAFALGKMGPRADFTLGGMKAVYVDVKDAKVREAIVFAMGEICREGAGAELGLDKLCISALTETDAHLRRSAAYTLGILKPRTEEMREALDSVVKNDKEAIVRQNAAYSLARFGEAALPGLQHALRDTDAMVKRDAASGLMYTKDASKVRTVLKDLHPLCKDPNSEVRRAALNVLVQIVESGDKEVIPSLLSALEDLDLENRRNAALALSNIGGADTAAAVPILLEAAKNGDKDLRPQAVLAFRNIGPAAAPAVPELIRFLQSDKDAKVREYAALAIGGIGSAAERAVPTLVEKIQDAIESHDVRVECAMALARIGKVSLAKDVAPKLLDVLGDTKHDVKVRERLIWALRIHGADLRNLTGAKETFARILKEPRTNDNKMLRYDCAYMLGMIWQSQAPDHTLDVLYDFLHDSTIKIFVGTDSTVVAKGIETPKVGTAKVSERGQGDGRIMAADALQMMGPARYADRADIMKQLRALSGDANLYEPLRKKVVALHDAGGK
ncbi:MAG: HEAT repeat domain-containing protein [Gemmataceae bacterium]|nr:HEAT repeat domain-containing protein [Gemmataceae bacterium]